VSDNCLGLLPIYSIDKEIIMSDMTLNDLFYDMLHHSLKDKFVSIVNESESDIRQIMKTSFDKEALEAYIKDFIDYDDDLRDLMREFALEIFKDKFLNMMGVKTKEEELREVARAMRDWIDAVPTHVQLPTMPGFDRDWADSIIDDIDD